MTNNSLSGVIQDWILNFKINIDLSYNNFTKSSATSCQHLNLNLASSYSSSAVTSPSTFCLKRNLPCAGKPQYDSLFINCGGPEEDFDGNHYQGSYKVKLHFAEIMFSDDQTFKSLGRRIFDVSIQGFKYLKDFNIVEEAGGVGKGITKEFDVEVNDNTLEIQLYWAGKGTTAIPDRGVYGPLISAITVTPNFKNHSEGMSTGVIIGIVAASCVLVVLIVFALWKMGFLCVKDLRDKDLLDLKTGYFSLRQIRAATNDFDPANKIGEGGFGPVFKVTYYA
ncbi:unnamed protein product [Vicia faba]|uniref:non-specific serine/threonine protein kinase n=1 Tax=Vicia faba TaxID=3906 RepID=A0AAV0ZQB8_VICFA|nr:unnamed protein product [Vicia faba]